MDISCAAIPCPVILNSTCVFYEGNTLVYTGINSGDNLQTALQKIDAKFEDAGLGYVFVNGIIQTAPGVPVELGGSLIHDTTISGNYTLTFAGNLQATALITTGGTSSDFVKGDGSLDNTSYQPTGNYLTDLTGDGTANGPGSTAFTLATVNSTIGTFGTSTMVPRITVNGKGLVTNIVNTLITVPSGALIFTGDVTGTGMTGAPVTLTLNPVNIDVYGPNTFLKFAVNGKGLVTSATLVTGFDIMGALGYTPVPNSRTLTINGVARDLSANRSWSVGTVTNVSVTAGTGIAATVINPTNTPSITITNTAPDQLVVLNSGTNISVTGTYPSFTIAATAGGGTVTSVGMTVPVGLTITGSPITVSGTLGLGLASGYSIPTISNQSNWTTAYNHSIVSAVVIGDGTKTLILTQQDAGTISASWTDSGLTSVGLNMPSAFTVSNSPLTSNGAISVTGAGTTAEYIRGDGSLSTFPSLAGYVTSVTASSPILSSGGTTPDISIPAATNSVSGYLTSTDWNIFDGKQPQLNGTGFVKASGTTITYDNSTYLTNISGIAAGGELSGTYPNPTLVNSAVIGKVLTGFNVTGGSVVATDDILAAFGKVQNQINGLIGGLIYQGAWNASTNTPALTSGVGTEGYFYITSVAGTTNLDGNANWHVGDWAVFNGTVWQIIDNTDSVTSVNGFIGAVVLSTTDIAEGTNLYYTDTRARNAISGGTGISYAPSTGIITNSAPDQTVSLSNGTAISVTGTYPNFTIANTAPDQTVALTDGTGISVTGTYPNFTITNTSPSSGGTVTGTGTTNTLPKFTSASSIGDSNVKDNGNVVSINATAGSFGALQVGNYNGSILMNTTSTSGGLIFQNTSSGNKLWDFSSYNDNINFNESNVGYPVMTLKSGGNVGIKQINPTYQLDVDGTFHATGAAVFGSTLSDGVNVYTLPSSTGTLALTSALSGYVPTSRTLTINGVGYDLSANRSWTINSMVYPSAGIAVSTGSAWGTSITDNSANWNTAYTNRITSLTTTGTSGVATLIANVLNIPNYSTDLSGYVPYTGATTNLNLGSFNLTSTNVTANGNVTLYGNLTGTKTISSGTPYNLTVTQNSTNATDTGDGAININHTLSGTGTGTELVTRSFIFSSDNQRTGGSVLTNSRVLYLVSSTQAGTNTTNLDQVYIEGGAMVGSVTNNRGVLVKTMQGTNQAAFVATGLTSSNRVHLLLGDYTLPTGAWGIYSGLSDSSYLQGTLLLGSATDSTSGAKLQVTGSIQQTSVTSAMLKTSSTGVLTAAVAGTDYQAALIGTGIVKSTIGVISYLTDPLPIVNGGTGSATKNFVDLTTDQTIAGFKTFNTTITLSNGVSNGFNFESGNTGFYASLKAPAGLGSNQVITLPSATGTLALTSSLSGYLPLTGGTLTGALGGTSATFSGQLHIPNNSTGTLGGLYFDYNSNAASRNWQIVSDYDAYGDFQIRQSTTQTGSTYAKILGFSPTGAATFSGDVILPYSKSLAFNSIANQYITADASGLYLGTANLARLFINTSGNVGIGGTNAASRFNVRGGNSNSQIELDNFGSGVNYILSYDRVAAAYKDIVLITNGSNNTIYASTSGNVGIGTTSPAYKFDVQVATNRHWAISASSTGFASFRAGDDGYNNFNRGEIDALPLLLNSQSGGNVLIGTTTDAGYKLDVNGTGRFGGNLKISLAVPVLNFFSTTTSTGYNIYQYTDDKFYIGRASGADLLTIASTGAATFSSSVTAGQGTFAVSSGDNLILEKPTGSYLSFKNGATLRGSISGNNGTDGINLNYGASHTTALAIASTGNVGIGTASPANKLFVVASGTATTNGNNSGLFVSHLTTGATTDGIGVGSNGSTSYKWIQTYNGTLSLNPTGNNVLIGTTTDAGFKLDVSGTGRFTGALTGTSASFSSTLSATSITGTSGSFSGNLTVTGASTVTFSPLVGTGSRTVLASATGVLSAPTSDRTVKENIQPLDYGIAEIMKLKPVSFEFIDEFKDYGEGKQIGNIAQDVAEVIPEAVFTTPSTGKMGINYNQFDGIYIKALQELQEQIKELQAQINK